jgi:hypothetical protein
MAGDQEVGKPGPERIELSERDSPRVLKLVENPPEPSAKLRAAAKRHREILGGGVAASTG